MTKNAWSRLEHDWFDFKSALRSKSSQFRLCRDKAHLLNTEFLHFKNALCCFGPGQSDQIGRDRGEPHIALKGASPLPSAAVKTQAPLDPGDDRLHPGTEAPQPVVDPLTAAHVFHFKPALLGKTHILDLSLLGSGQVGFGSKAPIQGHFQRVAPVNLQLPVKHRERQFGIGRIALSDHTVGDQVGGSHTQTHLVPVVGLPAVLDDDVGVGLEDRDDLLGGRDFLPPQHPALGLVDHPTGEIDIALQLHTQRQAFNAGVVLGRRNRRYGISHALGRQLEQIPVGRLTLRLLLGILHRQHPTLGAAAMIGKMHLHPALTQRLQQPSQHPHPVVEQGGVGRLMDVALHDRAVHANLPAFFDLLLACVNHQDPVDLLPGRGRDPFGVLRNGRFLEALVGNADAAEGAQRDGVGDVKGQQLVAVIKHPLDDRRAQHLLGTHPIGAGVRQLSIPAEVLMNQLGYGSFAIQYAADGLQLPGLGMIRGEVHQRQLFFALFAHFVVAPFSDFDSDIDF